jgi:hypothetical protein
VVLLGSRPNHFMELATCCELAPDLRRWFPTFDALVRGR